jgi:DNA-binding beta-propeller fold protein YncE
LSTQRRRHWIAALSLLAALLLLAYLASSARAGNRVYWVNQSAPDKIAWANVDGSGGANLSTAGAPGSQPRGVALDVAAGRVYWTDRAANLIAFANLDGSGGGGTLNTAGATVNGPNAAAVYPAAGKIYWANELGNRISYANLDNTGGGDLTITGATVSVPIAPMVDSGSGRIYWANGNPTNVISFANLDGTGGANLNTTGATAANPHGVALDPVAGRIYWANVNAPAISYANLNGSGGGNLNTAGATVNVPVGVAIDPAARRIYWANQAGNRISFANLDGSGGGDLSTPGATLSGSRSPALLQAPSPSGAPQITGAAKIGSVLSCSPGSWAPDLLASWLYRAPSGLAYSWSRNGANIPGASGATHTATARGSYRCTVTASNVAGSSAQTSAPHTVAAPAFGARTLVTMRLGARRIRGRGPIKMVVRNRNSFSVSGRVSAEATRGVSRSRAFVVGARAGKTIKLKLSKPLKRSLKRKRELSLRLVMKVRDPAGNSRTLRKNVSLRLKTA